MAVFLPIRPFLIVMEQNHAKTWVIIIMVTMCKGSGCMLVARIVNEIAQSIWRTFMYR